MTRSRDVSAVQNNLGVAIPPAVAGKNVVINGGFDVWQRGTTFTSPATNAYTADRWYNTQDGTGTVTISRQTFTPGNAITGYEPSFFLRQRVTAAGSTTFFQVAQKIEDVRTFAGQTVTFSFWAKADASKTGLFYVEQYFGTGGSPSATVQTVVGSPAYTTSWQRFSYTFTMPSISGKTIGTNNDSCVIVYIRNGATTLNSDLEIWGAQLELGSSATPFSRAGGTIQGELAACQRYYYRTNASSSTYSVFGSGLATSTTSAKVFIPYPSQMRTKVTSLETGGTIRVTDDVNNYAPTGYSMDANNNNSNIATVSITVASGLTQFRPMYVRSDNDGTAYFGFSAEL